MITFKKFGKGGGGTTSTEVDIPDIFKPYLTGAEGILPAASSLFGSGGFGAPDKAGTTTQNAWSSGLDLAKTLSSTLNPNLTSLFTNMQNPDKISGEVLDKAITSATDPLRTQYARSTIPSIEDAAAGAGAFGGSRQGIAEGLAKSDLDKNIANLDATMRYQAATDDASRQMQGNLYAAQFAPSLYSLLGAPTEMMSNVGQQQDYFSNLGTKADLNNLLGYGSFLQQFIPGTMSSSSTTKGGGSTFGNLLSGGGTGALLGAAIPGVGWGLGAGLGALGGLFG